MRQVQVVVWLFGVSDAAMWSRKLVGGPPACDGATVVLRGPVWALATELPLCFEALFGLGWCNNSLDVAQMVMVGAKQQGYLRAWLRRKKPSCDLGRL